LYRLSLMRTIDCPCPLIPQVPFHLLILYLGIMFDEAGDIVPVLVGPEAARVGGDPHYHTFDGNTVHYQGTAH